MWRRSLLSICIQKTEGKEKLAGNEKAEVILYKGNDHDEVMSLSYVEGKLLKITIWDSVPTSGLRLNKTIHITYKLMISHVQNMLKCGNLDLAIDHNGDLK